MITQSTNSRYDFCCCAVSSTHCYLQCLLRALSWVVAHPDTSATHRSSESSSSSSSSFVKYSLLLRPVALDPKAEELCLLFIGVAIRRSLRFVPDDGEPTARIICPRWRRRPGNLNLQNHHHHHLSFFFIHIMPTWIEFFALCANPRRMRLLCNCSGGRHRNGRGMGSRTP